MMKVLDHLHKWCLSVNVRLYLKHPNWSTYIVYLTTNIYVMHSQDIFMLKPYLCFNQCLISLANAKSTIASLIVKLNLKSTTATASLSKSVTYEQWCHS